MKPLMMMLLMMMLLFPQFYNPITLLLILLLSAFTLALILGLCTQFWFTYILILIYLGGLLVLFMYVVTLIPNEPTTILSPCIFLLVPFMFLLPKSSYQLDSTMMNMLHLTHYIKKIFLFSTWNMTLLLIIFLLFILLVVVKITLSKSGPLRLN